MIGDIAPICKAYLQFLCSSTDESTDSSETEDADDSSNSREAENLTEDSTDSSSEVEDPVEGRGCRGLYH
jgi:hypothetical protein